jgi:pSer/pThr/pTyr-binding forkhead associated (FHA) protein
MENYRQRSSSTREHVGLRQYSQSQSTTSLDERTTLTNPAALFQRSNSTASINTDTSRSDTPRFEDDTTNQKIIFQTGPRRSSVSRIGMDDPTEAKLIYQTSYGGNVEFLLIKDETTLGRKDDNDIVLSDVKISKRHAVITKSGSRYFYSYSGILSEIQIPQMESD